MDKDLDSKLKNIFFGLHLINLNGSRYFVRRPSPKWTILAESLEQTSLEELLDGGLLSDDEYEYFLYDKKVWLPNDEAKLKSLQKDMEELKVRMFQMNFNTKELDKAREVLKLATADAEKLWAKKHSYSFLSARSNTLLQKMKFLFAGSIFKYNDEPLIKTLKQYNHFSCSILDHAITQYRAGQADEREIRQFARTEPWRGHWVSRKATGRVFDVASIELNEQQKSLVNWSITFDSIAEHPAAPSDAVLSDPDRCDGWLILQKRERDKALGNNELDSLIKNENIRNSGEIFLPAGATADAQKIDDLNNDEAARLKRQRLAFVQKKGVVQEAEMPDSKLQIERQANEKFRR